MNNKTNDASVLNGLLGAAVLVVIPAGVRSAQSFVVPFLVAVFLAVISAQPRWWSSAKWRTMVSRAN